MIREHLTETVAVYEQLGHPAIMERFVLRNGKLFDIGQLIGKKQTPNQCYANASHFVLEALPDYNFAPRYSYVEGFILRPKLPIAFQHAWVRVIDSDSHLRGFDPTLDDGRESEYMGVEFDRETLMEQLRRNKVYGLLDHGHGINTDLIFRLDPELKPIVDEVIANRRRIA